MQKWRFPQTCVVSHGNGTSYDCVGFVDVSVALFQRRVGSRQKIYRDLSRIRWRLISASKRLCVHGETECQRRTVWICNDSCQEASAALQSEVTGEIRDRIRMAGEEPTCTEACWQSADTIDMLSVSLLTDEWIHAEHIVITCGTYMLLPLLLISMFHRVAPALEQHCPSVAATPPAPNCLEQSWMQLCWVHGPPWYLHHSWSEDSFKFCLVGRSTLHA